ncbi:MAG TPA: polysaccharide biosynthesis/export family protein [Sphingobacteriaceae bacterium]|uniref:polysaccharide biosynthesis/export family protein n=1 Tax=Moheibacter sp. TaxID=1965316 RepID=UPI002C0E1000|nr:polysaccharide biosynthesis/export family protein [Sphingobacteriaceae bacterium]
MKTNHRLWGMKYTLIGVIFWMITSCVPRERIVYFQGDLESVEKIAAEYSATIKPDDLLTITVYGRNLDATRIFNQESNNNLSGGDNQKTFLVDEEGNVEFPVLGKIKLAGLTRNEAIQYMKGLLSSEIIDPGVSISITNYRITVLGEVGSPGTYPLLNEKVTILEALGMAGDLTINGVRENVLVIRDEGEERNFYRVNLTSEEVFTSPVYYLSQNDVVYVEPNQAKINTSANTRNLSIIISVASFLLTVVALIIR